MPIPTILTILLIGLTIGVLGGILGIGGGVLIIPVLMMGFGFSQARANGTSVAMLLPPIGIFAVISYWRAGNVDIRFAMLLAIGFSIGAYFGSQLVNTGKINPTALRIFFAALLLFVASRLLFRTGGRAWVALQTTFLMFTYLGAYTALRIVGHTWSRPRPNWPLVYQSKLRSTVEYDYEI